MRPSFRGGSPPSRPITEPAFRRRAECLLSLLVTQCLKNTLVTNGSKPDVIADRVDHRAVGKAGGVAISPSGPRSEVHASSFSDSDPLTRPAVHHLSRDRLTLERLSFQSGKTRVRHPSRISPMRDKDRDDYPVQASMEAPEEHQAGPARSIGKQFGNTWGEKRGIKEESNNCFNNCFAAAEE
ncbi:hypothetical protein L209DRAFT_759369 [Thermothelomyces heterothallicus CBS 203.75]